MIPVAVVWTTLCYHIHFSGGLLANIMSLNPLTPSHRARRNAQGHLEPDASEEIVQSSLGFADYELAKKSDDPAKSPSSRIL